MLPFRPLPLAPAVGGSATAAAEVCTPRRCGEVSRRLGEASRRWGEVCRWVGAFEVGGASVGDAAVEWLSFALVAACSCLQPRQHDGWEVRACKATLSVERRRRPTGSRGTGTHSSLAVARGAHAGPWGQPATAPLGGGRAGLGQQPCLAEAQHSVLPGLLGGRKAHETDKRAGPWSEQQAACRKSQPRSLQVPEGPITGSVEQQEAHKRRGQEAVTRCRLWPLWEGCSSGRGLLGPHSPRAFSSLQRCSRLFNAQLHGSDRSALPPPLAPACGSQCAARHSSRPPLCKLETMHVLVGWMKGRQGRLRGSAGLSGRWASDRNWSPCGTCDEGQGWNRARPLTITLTAGPGGLRASTQQNAYFSGCVQA